MEQNVGETGVTYVAKKTLENELQNKIEKKKRKMSSSIYTTETGINYSNFRTTSKNTLRQIDER